MNMLRAKKQGNLNITDVMVVTLIMHKVKGNSKFLTLITILTALALGILSLSYISSIPLKQMYDKLFCMTIF